MLANPILVFAAVLVFGFMFWGVAAFPLISPDEPRYAETAREMLERMDFIIPYCDYLPRFDKPILFYWFEVISFKVFGLNEFAARMPSVLAGSGMVALAYLISNIYGFGFIAAVITATSLSIFLASKLAITDMMLCFFISATLVSFYCGYHKRLKSRSKLAFREKLSSKWFVTAWISMGFGMLCKGPVAVVLPLLIIFIFLLMQKDLKSFFEHTLIDVLMGVGIFLLITVPWFLWVHLKTQGAFTQEFFIGHNLARYAHVHTGHSGSIFYYIPVVILGLFPWSPFLLAAIKSSQLSTLTLKSEKAEIALLMRFSLTWSVVVLVFYSVSQTKLPTYILPIYLPLSIIIAKWFYDKITVSRSKSYLNQDALVGLIILLAVIIVAVIAALTLAQPALQQIDPAGFRIVILFIAFLLCSAVLIAMTAIFNNPRLAFIFLSCAVAISYLIATQTFLFGYAKYRDAGAKEIATKASLAGDLATYQVHGTNFAFYSQKRVVNLNKAAAVKFLVDNNSSPRYFVTKTKYLTEFQDQLAVIEHKIINQTNTISIIEL